MVLLPQSGLVQYLFRDLQAVLVALQETILNCAGQRRTKLLNSKSRYSLFWRIRGFLIGCLFLRK
jgi:hypothetical protein